MNNETIGFIGTGHMGTPMAENLLKAGYRLRVWNRTREKLAPLNKLGATAVEIISVGHHRPRRRGHYHRGQR